MSSIRQSVKSSEGQYQYNYQLPPKSPKANFRNSDFSNSQVNRQTMKRSQQSRPSIPEKAMSNYQQKMKALCRVRYINQLARLQYEEKLTQVHTKHSMKTKETVLKKIKAKNQIAEFIEQEEEYDDELDELIEFNHGNNQNKGYYFQRQSKFKEYSFCPMCDAIIFQTPEDHTDECQYIKLSNSPNYYKQSLSRIQNSLQRITSTQAQELSQIIGRIKRGEDVEEELSELMEVVKGDEILSKMGEKLHQIIKFI